MENIAKFTKHISIKSLLNFHSTFDLTISLATNQIIHCWLYVKINIIVEHCYSAFFPNLLFLKALYMGHASAKMRARYTVNVVTKMSSTGHAQEVML